eukprot:598673-Pelagomonas_calceolata.AAC.2
MSQQSLHSLNIEDIGNLPGMDSHSKGAAGWPAGQAHPGLPVTTTATTGAQQMRAAMSSRVVVGGI